MNVFKNIPSLAKGFGLLLILFTTAASLKAQDATITNNTLCSMKVVLKGVDASGTCAPCWMPTAVIVAPGQTIVVTLTGGGVCNQDYAVVAHVRAECGGPTLKIADYSCNPCGTGLLPSSGNFTIPAGCCFYALPYPASANVVCSGTDLTIDIN